MKTTYSVILESKFGEIKLGSKLTFEEASELLLLCEHVGRIARITLEDV